MISETHLTRNKEINLLGYNCYHAAHPGDRARGGAAILLKSTIKHYQDVKIEKDSVQMVTVNIELLDKGNFMISAIYCPPRQSLKKEDYIQFFNSLGNKFIIGGDFNAKNTFWGSRLSTTKGRELYKAGCESKVEFFSSGSPTYWPTDRIKIPDLIDFFVGKGISS